MRVVEVSEPAPGELTVHMADTLPSEVNALRRTVLADVRTLAIERVSIADNTSVMHDELLVQRLGLLPIAGADAEVVFTLDVRQEADGIRDVTAADLVCDDPSVRLATPNVVLTRLRRGQAVRLRAETAWGSGRDHAKWMPTSLCTYRAGADPGTYVMELETNGQLPCRTILQRAAQHLAQRCRTAADTKIM